VNVALDPRDPLRVFIVQKHDAAVFAQPQIGLREIGPSFSEATVFSGASAEAPRWATI
jgi:hypothetical protein